MITIMGVVMRALLAEVYIPIYLPIVRRTWVIVSE